MELSDACIIAVRSLSDLAMALPKVIFLMSIRLSGRFYKKSWIEFWELALVKIYIEK